jgi:hypothetical protein
VTVPSMTSSKRSLERWPARISRGRNENPDRPHITRGRSRKNAPVEAVARIRFCGSAPQHVGSRCRLPSICRGVAALKPIRATASERALCARFRSAARSDDLKRRRRNRVRRDAHFVDGPHGPNARLRRRGQ